MLVLLDLDMLVLQYTNIMRSDEAVEHEFNQPPKIRHDVNHAFGSSAMLVGFALFDPYLLTRHRFCRLNQHAHLLLVKVIAGIVGYVEFGTLGQLVEDIVFVSVFEDAHDDVEIALLRVGFKSFGSQYRQKLLQVRRLDLFDQFAREVRADVFVEAFDEGGEEGLCDLPSRCSCLFDFQPFHRLLFEQFLFVLRSYALLVVNVIVKLFGKLDGFLFHRRFAGFLVIGLASKVADLPVAARFTQIDDKLGGIAFDLRDCCRVRRCAMGFRFSVHRIHQVS